MTTDSKLPTPQRGQIWRDREVGSTSTYEVLDDRHINGGWAVLATTDRGTHWANFVDLHNGNYEPPRPEVETYWVNVYGTGFVSNPHRRFGIADDVSQPGRICRVPLIPDWGAAVYDAPAPEGEPNPGRTIEL